MLGEKLTITIEQGIQIIVTNTSQKGGIVSAGHRELVYPHPRHPMDLQPPPENIVVPVLRLI